jgi:hypothetical protein
VGAAATFFEGLHPQGFGDVGDGFGEAVQGGGTCVESRGEGLPPGVEHGVDGVGGALADLGADLVDGGALAGSEQRVGGVADVALSYSARRRAEGSWGWGGVVHVSDNTINVCCSIGYIYANDNGIYHWYCVGWREIRA